MPKVGCFWPGLFKSSNCLFPWAARETGKCSFLALQFTFQYQTVRAGGDHGIPLSPRQQGLLCRLALHAPMPGIAQGLPPKGLSLGIFSICLFCNISPLLGHPK